VFLNCDEVGNLAPIATVMPFFDGLKPIGQKTVFEWKAGCPFLNCFVVSLLKKLQLFKC